MQCALLDKEHGSVPVFWQSAPQADGVESCVGQQCAAEVKLSTGLPSFAD